jgi:hypothetical protein
MFNGSRGGRMKHCTWMVGIALAMPIAVAHAQTPPQDAPAAGTAANTAAQENANTEAPEKKRRLKFKNDRPTCVCANPVGEAAIEAAAADRATTESQPRRSEK